MKIMKHAFLCLIITLTIFITGCSKIKKYDVEIITDNYEVKEEFLKNHKTYGSYNTTGDFIDDKLVHDEYTFLIQNDEELNKIFSQFINIDFNKQMVIVYIYTSIYNSDTKITEVDIEEGELSIDFKHKLIPFTGSVTVPTQKVLVIVMNKVNVKSVDVDLDD